MIQNWIWLKDLRDKIVTNMKATERYRRSTDIAKQNFSNLVIVEA